jgi:AraC-like DNA-binding protein
VHQGDREIVVNPGQFAVYDVGQPYGLRLEGNWTCAVMTLRRDLIDVSAKRLRSAMGRAHPSGQGPGLLLSQFITTVAHQMDSVDGSAACKLGEAGAYLLAGSVADDGDAATRDSAEFFIDRLMGYIRAHLEDPRLSRASIAAAHHISPRTLDRLFSGQEWSVNGYIRHERLEAVRCALENPALSRHAVAAIAARWCFFDAAHFSRLFRDTYGYPPSLARGERLSA